MTVETRLRRAAHGIHRAVETMEASMKIDEDSKIERFDRFRRRTDRNRAIGAILLVGVLAALAFAAASAARDTGPVTPADQTVAPAPTNIGTVSITRAGCTLDGVMTPGTGPFTLTVHNVTDGDMDVTLFPIAGEKRFESLLRLVDGIPRNPRAVVQRIATRFLDQAGPRITVSGHDSSAMSGWLHPGTYGIWCGVNGFGSFWQGLPSGPTSGPMSAGERRADFIGPIQVR